MRNLAMNFDVFELVLVVLVVFTYWPAIRGGWVFDDWAINDDEADFQKSLAWRLRFIAAELRRPFRFGGGAARWFTYLVYHVTYKVWGFRPAAWHGVSIAMHAAAVVILHRLTLLWGFGPGQAAGAAAVFALHPLQVGSVAYVSGRPGLQSLLLTFAGLYTFALGAWPASIVFQYLAWRSKEDSIIYVAFYPIAFYLFG